jgi:non-ribosomal peptide synthetase component E (peptide arylation enzyme)
MHRNEEVSNMKMLMIGDVVGSPGRRILKEQLPVFMVPGRLHRLEALPVTGRGKIDRKELRENF